MNPGAAALGPRLWTIRPESLAGSLVQRICLNIDRMTERVEVGATGIIRDKQGFVGYPE
jgi:hypothetical protein